MARGFDPDVFTSSSASGGFDPEVFTSSQAPAVVPDPVPPKRKGTGSTAIDSANAYGTGFWRGATRLAGLPVDTAANLIDLVKAGVGTAYSGVTKNAPPDALMLADRSQVVGSSDWLLNQIRKTQAGRTMVDPVNPEEYEGGYIQAAGGGTSGAMFPGSVGQTINRGLIGATSAAAGKATYDVTGSTPLAITASLLPAGAQHYGDAGAKRGIRGGEEGRRKMQQRIADLKAAGIDEPTLGLASGNRLIGGIENLLQSTPGAIGVMSRAREGAIDGMRRNVTQAADTASPVRGADVSGTAIRNDLRGPLKDRVSQGYAGLNDVLERLIGPHTLTQVQSAITRAQQLTAPQPGAPATSSLLTQPRIAGIGRALETDAGGMPAQTINSPILGRDGVPLQTQIPAVSPQGVPFRTLKELRTKIGGEGASNAIMGTPEQAQWKQLYGAMSDDMRGAARASDMGAGPQRNNIGPAERTLNRANDFYRAGMQRIERVEPFATTKAPEEAFLALARSTREHVSTLQAVKKSVTPDTRGKIAATVIDRLGRASPGAQNELSDVFSTERFLTNYASMTPKARNELFSGFPGALSVRRDVEAAAKAASYMRENSRMWANPSGTAAATTARALILGAPLSATVSPWAPLVIGGGMALSRGAGEMLTSPGVRHWAAGARAPQLMPGMLGGVQGGGLLGLSPTAQE